MEKEINAVSDPRSLFNNTRVDINKKLLLLLLTWEPILLDIKENGERKRKKQLCEIFVCWAAGILNKLQILVVFGLL